MRVHVYVCVCVCVCVCMYVCVCVTPPIGGHEAAKRQQNGGKVCECVCVCLVLLEHCTHCNVVLFVCLMSLQWQKGNLVSGQECFCFNVKLLTCSYI